MRPRYADLIKALKDPDPRRADTAFDGILFDRAEALPDLEECFRASKKDALIRFYMIQLMGFTEDARAIPTVIEALRDPDANVRAEACRALEDLRAADAVHDLQERLQDLDLLVREAAAEALAALGH